MPTASLNHSNEDHAMTTTANQTTVIAPIRERHSPRLFSPQAISPAELGLLFEAARWAASSYNEQPWRFIVARREDPAFAELVSCLVPANSWAADVPILMLSIAKMAFDKNSQPNVHAWHDVGLAMSGLSIQAAAMGLQLHQMAGFDPARARATFAIPEGFQPVAMGAIGYPADPQRLSEQQLAQERRPRQRMPLASFVFGRRFGDPLAAITPV
jgi:nitroreductase